MNGLLSDAHSWAIILGVLSPILVSVVTRPQWASWQRQLVALVAAVVLGLGDAVAHGVVTDGATLLQLFAIVMAASEASYRTLMSKVAPAVQKATSPHIDGVMVGKPTDVPLDEIGEAPTAVLNRRVVL